MVLLTLGPFSSMSTKISGFVKNFRPSANVMILAPYRTFNACSHWLTVRFSRISNSANSLIDLGPSTR